MWEAFHAADRAGDFDAAAAALQEFSQEAAREEGAALDAITARARARGDDDANGRNVVSNVPKVDTAVHAAVSSALEATFEQLHQLRLRWTARLQSATAAAKDAAKAFMARSPEAANGDASAEAALLTAVRDAGSASASEPAKVRRLVHLMGACARARVCCLQHAGRYCLRCHPPIHPPTNAHLKTGWSSCLLRWWTYEVVDSTKTTSVP